MRGAHVMTWLDAAFMIFVLWTAICLTWILRGAR